MTTTKPQPKRINCKYRVGPLLCTREATTTYKGMPVCAGCEQRLNDKERDKKRTTSS